MPVLDMRNIAVYARQDMAWALRNNGFPIPEIMIQLKYSNPSSTYRAIRAGALRSKDNERRISTRRFGVEMEFNGCGRRRVEENLHAKVPDFPMYVESYNHEVKDSWKLITDASVNGSDVDYDDCGEGLEMVSPILSGTNGFQQLSTILDAIHESGGEVDSSCGLHVHHDARDLSPKQITALLRFYMENQKVIDRLLAPSRRSSRNSYYCQPWGDREKETVLTRSMTGRKDDLNGFNRYRTINVASYPKYGSIEFRQHQGTLNQAKIVGWVKFGQAMVEATAATVDDPPALFTEVAPMLAWMIEKGGLARSTAKYLQGRADNYDARIAARSNNS